MDSQYDVIIAGAGPGGSTCALALAHSGLRVLILDKDRFPRDKICGDAVNSRVNKVLRKIDPELVNELQAFIPKSKVTGVMLHGPNWKYLKISRALACYCIKRVDFDHWLFQKVNQSQHLTVLQDTALKKVHSNENGITIETSLGQEFHSKIIIGCDGAHSIVAKQLAGFKMNRYHYGGAVRQYYQDIKGLDEQVIEIFLLKGYLPGYFWIFPVSGQQANVGFGMLSHTIAKRKIDLKKCLHQIIRTIPEVAQRFEQAHALDEIKGFGLPMGSQKCSISGHRFLLCGDAASLIDPVSGEGIVTAMESGLLAAEQVKSSFANNDFTAPALKVYEHNVYNRMWPTFQKHYRIQRLAGNNAGLVNTLVRIGNIPYVHHRIQAWFNRG